MRIVSLDRKLGNTTTSYLHQRDDVDEVHYQ